MDAVIFVVTVVALLIDYNRIENKKKEVKYIYIIIVLAAGVIAFAERQDFVREMLFENLIE
ncbi:hypothetical protein F8154_07735 [Alkaliphilus pronyensis]|uniref:Uncharacterized protein n=1 Tax=Alkaliphilus pronyensis TaxID=1482732 RepID=A0A6I0F578_9FIRM|nr:hypothetical protein [Alkaliphilus pronyensis]KAB3534869.1 hypothetical protein F8154_07735 [Alkaliphilus pronyensis]